MPDMSGSGTFGSGSSNRRTIVSHNTKDPTRVTYVSLTDAYDWFNRKLFDGGLPAALITMQRRRGSYGYFASERFETRDRSDIVDEIALNPVHFEERSDDKILSTLVHEMCHLWQFRFGKPSRGGYHNKQWAEQMKSVGLQPDNGNGRETGQSVSHHIIPGGPFALTCTALLQEGTRIDYVDVWGQGEGAIRKTRTNIPAPAAALMPGANQTCTSVAGTASFP